MADAYTFDAGGAQRIVDAVRTVERQSPPAPPTRRPRTAVAVQLLAKLREVDDDGNWSWVGVYPQPDGPYIEIDAATSGDDHTAAEYNSNSAKPDDVVWLDYWGTHDGTPLYRFSNSVANAIRAKCVDDYGHGQPYVSVRALDAAGTPVGDPFDVEIVHHTTATEVFTVVPRGAGFVQIGYPAGGGQFAVLQRMDGTGSPQSIAFDRVKVY